MDEEEQTRTPDWGRTARTAVLMATVLLPFVIISLVYTATGDMNTSVAVFAIADPWRLAFAAGTIIAPFAAPVLLAPLISFVVEQQPERHDELFDDLAVIEKERATIGSLSENEAATLIASHEKRLLAIEAEIKERRSKLKWRSRGAAALIVATVAGAGLVSGGWPLALLYSSVGFAGILWVVQRDGWVGLEFLEKVPAAWRILTFGLTLMVVMFVVDVFPTARVALENGSTASVDLVASDLDGYWYIQPRDREAGVPVHLAWQAGPVASVVVCTYRWNQCDAEDPGTTPSVSLTPSATPRATPSTAPSPPVSSSTEASSSTPEPSSDVTGAG